MHYTVFSDMAMGSADYIQSLLPRVSSARREQALRYTHLFGRFASLQTYIMLDWLLREHDYLSPGQPMPDWLYSPLGKPYMEGMPHFSISHCQTALAVAIHEQSIGIDVERIRHADAALIERTMNPREQQLIAQSAEPERQFTALWTRKEAVLKCLGTGLVDDLWSVLPSFRGQVQTFEQPSFICSIAIGL